MAQVLTQTHASEKAHLRSEGQRFLIQIKLDRFDVLPPEPGISRKPALQF